MLEAFCRELVERGATGVPALHTTQADDGSVIVEWTFRDRRLGFSFEPNPEESGWYFVWF